MKTENLKRDKARFDIRLSKEQKLFFERASQIGGYRSLTDFIVLTVQEKAKQIISEQEQIIASQKDSEIFFDAIINSSEPNKSISDAATEYKNLLSE